MRVFWAVLVASCARSVAPVTLPSQPLPTGGALPPAEVAADPAPKIPPVKRIEVVDLDDDDDFPLTPAPQPSPTLKLRRR